MVDLTNYLIDAGHRLSVSQHSQIIKRVERAIHAEAARRAGLPNGKAEDK